MRNTPYKGYALYEPDASPDLTESGEYNTALMAVDADMHGEEQARIEGDAALNIAIANEMAQRRAADDALNKRIDTETAERKAADTALDAAYKAADAALDTAYKAADTALGKRIDNAEAEISANSADLTGIKGLTYGDTHVNFLENSNGEYSSPALDEIAEQNGQRLSYICITSTETSLGAASLAKLNENWPHVVILMTDHLVLQNVDGFLVPRKKTDDSYIFVSPYISYADGVRQPVQLTTIIGLNGTGPIHTSYIATNVSSWPQINNKPFATIGTGLKVVDDALTVDTSALPSALTIMQLSEFGELTDNTGSTHSAIGDGNAAAYAKLKQAWPSVIVVEGGTSWRCGMYTPSNVEQAGYILVKSANITDSAIQMRIHGGGFSGAITLEEIGG